MASKHGMTFKEPEYLDRPANVSDAEQKQSTAPFHIDELTKGSEFYDRIVSDFENAGLRVEKVERLKNHRLMKKYITERDQLHEEKEAESRNFKLNEKYLYHGTSAKKEQICEEGLDSRMSKHGCFGRGIYFSDYPRKCKKYAEKDGSSESLILLARVILGETKVYRRGEKDRSLVREPEKTQPYTGSRFYDSVQGCPVNHNEFVVYESRRALVECIVTYSVPSSESVQPDAEAPIPVIEDSETSSDDDEPDTKKERRSAWPKGDDDASDSSGEEEVEVDQENAEADQEEANAWQNPKESFLERQFQSFSQQTGEFDKHIIETYLNMVDLDLDRAVALYKQSTTNEGPWTKEDVEAPEKLITSQPHTNHVDPDKYKNMSQDDKDAAMKNLVDSMLEAMGRELNDEAQRKLAKKFLKASEMDLDEAMCMYISTLASRA